MRYFFGEPSYGSWLESSAYTAGEVSAMLADNGAMRAAVERGTLTVVEIGDHEPRWHPARAAVAGDCLTGSALVAQRVTPPLRALAPAEALALSGGA
jgi:hypothetical protein